MIPPLPPMLIVQIAKNVTSNSLTAVFMMNYRQFVVQFFQSFWLILWYFSYKKSSHSVTNSDPTTATNVEIVQIAKKSLECNHHRYQQLLNISMGVWCIKGHLEQLFVFVSLNLAFTSDLRHNRVHHSPFVSVKPWASMDYCHQLLARRRCRNRGSYVIWEIKLQTLIDMYRSWTYK